MDGARSWTRVPTSASRATASLGPARLQAVMGHQRERHPGPGSSWRGSAGAADPTVLTETSIGTLAANGGCSICLGADRRGRGPPLDDCRHQRLQWDLLLQYLRELQPFVGCDNPMGNGSLVCPHRLCHSCGVPVRAPSTSVMAEKVPCPACGDHGECPSSGCMPNCEGSWPLSGASW